MYALEKIKKVKGAYYWKIPSGFFSLKKQFEINNDEVVICGLASRPESDDMEWLFTNKGLYSRVKCKFIEYNKLKFSKNFIGTISVDGSLNNCLYNLVKDTEETINILNNFVEEMKNSHTLT